MQEIKVSELIFGTNKLTLPKIKKNNLANDPKFQESVIRDLLMMAQQKKTGKSKHLIGEIKEEIFRSFKFEQKKVDSIVNYIDSIIVATEKVIIKSIFWLNFYEKTKVDAQNTLDFMQETREKCQKLDIQMEEFLEGIFF